LDSFSRVKESKIYFGNQKFAFHALLITPHQHKNKIPSVSEIRCNHFKQLLISVIFKLRGLPGAIAMFWKNIKAIKNNALSII
jgi:hypothetical protein